MVKRFEDMTDEEKQLAFQKWLQGREGRKVQSTARRKAIQQLIAANRPQYNKLLAAAGGKVKAD